MEEIFAQQRNKAKPVSAIGFFGGILGVVITLALAQMLTNMLIAATGIGLLNIVFYLYAIALLLRFMGKTVAGSLYMIKGDTLYLQKMLGDSTLSVTEIPLEQVVGVRTIGYGERLACSYGRVTVVDAAAAQTLRMRFSFGAALFSARLARKVAGKAYMQPRAHIVVFKDEGKRHACVFMPDESFLAALKERLPEAFDHDDRADGHLTSTLWAQALQRAFPPLYTHVSPLLSGERLKKAEEEIERQKTAKKKPAAAKADAQEKEEAGKTNDEV